MDKTIRVSVEEKTIITLHLTHDEEFIIVFSHKTTTTRTALVFVCNAFT